MLESLRVNNQKEGSAGLLQPGAAVGLLQPGANTGSSQLGATAELLQPGAATGSSQLGATAGLLQPDATTGSSQLGATAGLLQPGAATRSSQLGATAGLLQPGAATRPSQQLKDLSDIVNLPEFAVVNVANVGKCARALASRLVFGDTHQSTFKGDSKRGLEMLDKTSLLFNIFARNCECRSATNWFVMCSWVSIL